MTREKRTMSDAEIKEYIRQNMPSMQEIAPQEFQAMVKNGEIMAEKLVAYMQGSLRGREDAQLFALAAFVAPEVTIEVGAVVVGIVAGEIAGAKAHAGQTQRLGQEE